MTDPPDFASFLARVRAGDPQAAEELVRRFEPAIRVIVRAHMSSGLRRQFDSMDRNGTNGLKLLKSKVFLGMLTKMISIGCFAELSMVRGKSGWSTAIRSRCFRLGINSGKWVFRTLELQNVEKLWLCRASTHVGEPVLRLTLATNRRIGCQRCQPVFSLG